MVSVTHSVLNELPMPLIDKAAISQPCSCLGNSIVAFRPKAYFHNSNYIISSNNNNNDRWELGLSSSFCGRTFFPAHKKWYYSNLARMGLRRPGSERFMVKSMVATVEKVSNSSSSSSTVSGGSKRLEGHQNNVFRRVDMDPAVRLSSRVEDDSAEELDEREKLRRMRISKANKGKAAWNKGRKHSEETLRKIKERTRLAMQDPKVKMKLVSFGHAQSEETKIKIGVGVRLGWEKRREKLMLQETCLYDWHNLIANAARMGVCGEDEMQWDSYKVLDKQLKIEWVESVEQRKNTSRPKGSKRAPKSAEQRRKISAAIAAKWADPDYRTRVHSGLARFHGISENAERKPRKKPIGDGQTRKIPKLKGDAENSAKHDTKSPSKKIRLKKSKAPLYKDPLASSKLELLKNIRAQRVTTINKKTEAITRAKLLIAEAEKAAEALEIAAQNSSLAQMSLMESRMLIAEAMQFVESIPKEDAASFEGDDDPAQSKTISVPNDLTEEINMEIANHRKVNGVHSLSSSGMNEQELSFNKFLLSDFMEDNASDSCVNGPDGTDEEPQEMNFYAVNELEDQFTGATPDGFLPSELNNSTEQSNITMGFTDPKLNHNGIKVQLQSPLVDGLKVNGEASSRKTKVIKKWVRGRLVEVEEEM